MLQCYGVKFTVSVFRLSPATFPKFCPLKEYSLSFTALFKRFGSLYFLHLQQCPLNFILYINSVLYFTFYIDFYQSCARERANTINNVTSGAQDSGQVESKEGAAPQTKRVKRRSVKVFGPEWAV
jgi:hypothetical protein